MQLPGVWIVISLLGAALVASEASAEPPAAAAETAAESQPSAAAIGPPAGAKSQPTAADPKRAPRPLPDPAFADWGAPGSEGPPAAEPRVHAAVMLGVGASADQTPAGVNPLGFGFGVRGNYRWLPELAFGARFLYFVGGSASLPTADIAMSTWLLAAEASWVLAISAVVLEPGLALGFSVRAVDGRAPFVDGRAAGFASSSEDRTDVGLYFAPGVAVTVPLAEFAPELEPLFVGGDARLGLVFADGVSGSFELMLQAGVRF